MLKLSNFKKNEREAAPISKEEPLPHQLPSERQLQRKYHTMRCKFFQGVTELKRK